jgi:hypothetical protein
MFRSVTQKGTKVPLMSRQIGIFLPLPPLKKGGRGGFAFHQCDCLLLNYLQNALKIFQNFSVAKAKDDKPLFLQKPVAFVIRKHLVPFKSPLTPLC